MCVVSMMDNFIKNRGKIFAKSFMKLEQKKDKINLITIKLKKKIEGELHNLISALHRSPFAFEELRFRFRI